MSTKNMTNKFDVLRKEGSESVESNASENSSSDDEWEPQPETNPEVVVEQPKQPQVSKQANKPQPQGKRRKGRYKTVGHYKLSCSYDREIPQQQRRPSRPSRRYQAMSRLKDKKAMAERLVCTQPCRNVVIKCKPVLDKDGQQMKNSGGHLVWSSDPDLDEAGQYQFVRVCTREVCTFAHSLDEYKLPECQFGKSCRSIWGVVTSTGDFDERPESRCAFWHRGIESHEEYYERTQRQKPLLPQTAERSRCPKKPESHPTQIHVRRTKDNVATIYVPCKDLIASAVDAALARGLGPDVVIHVQSESE